MIRFCDKEVYNVKEGEITRSQLLSFFLRNKVNRFSVVAVYGADESFIGMITYQSILESTEIEESICTDTIRISDHFWEEISEFLGGGQKR